MKRPKIISLIIIAVIFVIAAIWKNLDYFSGNSIDESSALKTDQITAVNFRKNLDMAEESRNAGNYRRAAGFYEEALKINEKHEGVLYDLGNVHLILKNFEAAGNYWMRLVKLNPEAARGWLQLGTVSFCLDAENELFDIAMAEDYYKKASELNREDTGPRMHLSKVALFRGDYTKASKLLNDVSFQNFMNVEVAFLQGYINWKTGREQDGIQQVNEALKIYRSLDNLELRGEGGTGKGARPMLADNMHCDFMNDNLLRLLKLYPENSPQILKEFDEKMLLWTNQVSR